MIPRWMPYSTPIYIDPLKTVFERLLAKGTETHEESNSSKMDPLRKGSNYLS